MESILTVSKLVKVYGGTSAANATRALDGISFGVEKGELVAIMGPSGSGKSTLLNCVATIDRPTSGSVLIGGVDASHMRARELAQFRREQLGFIFQDSNLLDTLTCRENIALPLTIGRTPAAEVDERVERIAGSLGVTKVLEKYPYQVSGGQKQRVAACRAMVAGPTLVLADEPTGALDSKNSRVLLERFETMNQQAGVTILMVTHDSFAASFCQRVLFIRDGRLFTEIRRGDSSRREFFDRIMEVVATIGGGEDAL
ncbi:MAG: ABC transporter ATP-binding protein [Tractidigestivibacter sp.]|jgi:putative ABC transport system ATP-binding protein|uniref:ABC transporter ATP-binding protein n=1 Tax=Tractidigestivibacter sp. TaxID=2847320 RepID=UPI003D93875E